MVLKTIRKKLLTALAGIEQGADMDLVKLQIAHAIAALDELIRQGQLPSVMEQMGQRGGMVTAQRGPDYFRELAARRKTYSGGRPRKDAE